MAAAALLPLASAHAQTEKWATSQISGRIGAGVPLEDDLRDRADIWFALGLDLEMSYRLFSGAETVFSIDWLTHSGGDSDNIFPFTLSQRWYTGIPGSRTYFHAGIGASILDFDPSDFVLSGRAGFGFEFRDQYFMEFNLFVTDQHGSNNISGSSAAAYIGMRF